jgi:hypothetical protein
VKFHGRIRNVCVGGKATALAGKKIKEDYIRVLQQIVIKHVKSVA